MKNIFNILNEGFQNKYVLEADDTSSKHLKGNFYAEWIPEVFETGAYRIYDKRFPEQTISYVDSIDEIDYLQLKESWVDKLPGGVRNRLGNCRSSRNDIETLVNVKWQSMKEEGKDKKGFTKEDALVSILDLLDSNGQFVDLTKDEYDELKEELNEDRKDLAKRIRKGELKHGNSLANDFRNKEEVADADNYDSSFGFEYDEDGDTKIQIQDRGSNTYYIDYNEKHPRTKSNSWGRVWKDGELERQFEGPKYAVRKDMAKYLDDTNESLDESIDISEYEEVSPIRDGNKTYRLFRKLEDGKGKWAALEMNKDNKEAFEITYNQARGLDFIKDSSISKLSRFLGKKLLPNDEKF